MKLEAFTALILRHPTETAVLLLKRNLTKKRWPGYITGIGGQVEFLQDEAADLVAAAMREFMEETHIPPEQVTSVRLRLSTLVSREASQHLLFWLTAQLLDVPSDLSCPDGILHFYPLDNLPTTEMIPTARMAIPFICSLPDNDLTIYTGIFTANELITTKSGI